MLILELIVKNIPSLDQLDLKSEIRCNKNFKLNETNLFRGQSLLVQHLIK